MMFKLERVEVAFDSEQKGFLGVCWLQSPASASVGTGFLFLRKLTVPPHLLERNVWQRGHDLLAPGILYHVIVRGNYRQRHS